MRSSKSRGFTLIELMVVVAVVAILAGVALPSLQSQIRKARRADATSALMAVQSAQEKYRANNATYGTMAQIGAATTSTDGYYTIAITASSNTATGYVATAGAVTGKSQARDTGCTTLTVTVTNSTPTFTPTTCFSK